MTVATLHNPEMRRGIILGNILKHAIHVSTIEGSGDVYKQPLKSGDRVIFRQVVPFGATTSAPNTFSTTAAAHLMQEGVNPGVESLQTLDVECTVQKYGAAYGYTEKQKSLGEDDLPAWMEEQLGERLGLVRELVYIAALDASTNRFYSGGTTRATVDEPVTRNLVDRITRSFDAAHAQYVKSVIKPSVNIGTSSVQDAYLAYGHTDMRQDIEAIAGYIPVKDYGTMQKAHDKEIGAVGAMRFILSPDFPKVIDAGAAIAGTSNISTTGTSADVYKLYVCAKNWWGHCAFRGLDAIDFTHLTPSMKDKSDFTGERGYVAGTFYDCALITNQGWGAVAECTVSTLT